jgi:hypothetical protein
VPHKAEIQSPVYCAAVGPVQLLLVNSRFAFQVSHSNCTALPEHPFVSAQGSNLVAKKFAVHDLNTASVHQTYIPSGLTTA